jgi:hypothetical protein
MPNNSKFKIANISGEEKDWNFRTSRLADGLEGADFVSSESVLLLASPDPIYGQNSLNHAVAVALAQDIQLSQQRQSSQVFEIGSRRKYTFSSGRIAGQMRLSRILFDGPSLLKSLMPTPDALINPGGDDRFAIDPTATEMGDHAGYGDFFINLGSTLFSYPIGLFIVLRDVSNQNVGAIFLQEAYITSHGMNVSSNQPFIGENVDILFEGVFPVQHREGIGISPSKLPIPVSE